MMAERDFFTLTDEQRMTAMAELAKLGIRLNENGINGDAATAPRAALMEDRASLRRAVNVIQDRALKRLDEHPGNKWNKDLQAKYDADIDVIANLGAYIDRASRLIENFDHADRAMEERAVANGTAWGTQGKKVHVLTNKQNLSDLRTDGARPGNVGFGELIRSMALGGGSMDVRNALSEGADATGGVTVPTYLSNRIIDRMRAKTAVIQAGALTVPLETQKTVLARLASDPLAGWRLENGAIAESDPTFERVEFVAKSLAVLVKVSRELLEDSVNLEDALMTAFAGSMAVELDRVALLGDGVNPEPLGIFNTTGIGSVSMGTNGLALSDYDPLLDTLYELEVDNAGPATAMVMHPRTWRSIAKLKDTTNQPLQAPADLAAIPKLRTTTIPIDQTQGTAVNASSIILGDFTQLMIGVRTQLRVELLRELFAANHQYAFVAHLRADIQVAHPESFAKLIGIIP